MSKFDLSNTRRSLVNDLKVARNQLTQQIIRVLFQAPRQSKKSDLILAETIEQVISKQVIKESAIYRVSLARDERQPQYIKLRVESSDILENLSQAPQPHTVTKELSASCEDVFRGSTMIDCFSIKRLATEERLEEIIYNYEGRGERDATGKMVSHRHPMALEAEDRIAVEIWTEQMRDCNDTEAFIVLGPTLHTEISVRAPADLDVTVNSYHPTQDPRPIPTRMAGEHKWEIPKPLLPGQGFEVVWKERRPQ